jgi:hypothetical protein
LLQLQNPFLSISKFWVYLGSKFWYVGIAVFVENPLLVTDDQPSFDVKFRFHFLGWRMQNRFCGQTGIGLVLFQKFKFVGFACSLIKWDSESIIKNKKVYETLVGFWVIY